MRLKLINDNKRSCGACTVCCTLMGVGELDKPVGVTCGHCTGHGCSIHRKPGFPDSCRTYSCCWRDGLGQHEDRPDKLGVLLHVDREFGYLVAMLLRTRANDDRVREYLGRLSEQQPVVVALIDAPGKYELIRIEAFMGQGSKECA